MLGKHEMHKPESEYLPHFYVDFNVGARSITFFGVQEKGLYESDRNPLVFVKILDGDLKTSVLIATKKPNYYQLTLILDKPLYALSTTKYCNETVVIMIIKGGDIEIFKRVMGTKFEVKYFFLVIYSSLILSFMYK